LFFIGGPVVFDSLLRFGFCLGSCRGDEKIIDSSLETLILVREWLWIVLSLLDVGVEGVGNRCCARSLDSGDNCGFIVVRNVSLEEINDALAGVLWRRVTHALKFSSHRLFVGEVVVDP